MRMRSSAFLSVSCAHCHVISGRHKIQATLQTVKGERIPAALTVSPVSIIVSLIAGTFGGYPKCWSCWLCVHWPLRSRLKSPRRRTCLYWRKVTSKRRSKLTQMSLLSFVSSRQLCLTCCFVCLFYDDSLCMRKLQNETSYQWNQLFLFLICSHNAWSLFTSVTPWCNTDVC